ncbi:hypothetical protein [Sphingomonas endolithica]|uniref:hypothetical protein n=1 Tax=Sphingomonas endolithica TaxID=2972485 RepID=UPI0021AE4EBF|nr:hypothetical protein [Sphingomonas sp. ZFBP2030]
MANKPTDQPRRYRASLRTGDPTGKGGQALLGQYVLEQDFQAIGHQYLELSCYGHEPVGPLLAMRVDERIDGVLAGAGIEL